MTSRHASDDDDEKKEIEGGGGSDGEEEEEEDAVVDDDERRKVAVVAATSDGLHHRRGLGDAIPNWLLPCSIVVHRIIASPTGRQEAGLISFGKTTVKAKGKVPTFIDPYAAKSGTLADDETAEAEKSLSYDASLFVNRLTAVSLWPVYRIIDLKKILSAYIGCPVHHIVLADETGRPFSPSIEGDFLRSVRAIGGDICIYLLGDWIGKDGAERYFRDDLLHLTLLETVRRSERIRILTGYVMKEEALSTITTTASSTKIPLLHGSITQTELVASPSGGGGGPSFLDNSRIFGLLHLDNGSSGSGQDWLTALAYNDGEKVTAKVLQTADGLPEALSPTRTDSLKALLLVREKPTPWHIHPFLISVQNDFRITVSANWAEGDNEEGAAASSRTRLHARSEKALQSFLRRLYNFFEEDVMRPDSSLPPRRTIKSALSIAAYRENYEGGDFEAFREMVALLARADLVHITYITPSSIYFKMPQGFSVEREFDLRSFLSTRSEGMTSSFDTTMQDATAFVSKGPEIQLKAEAKEMFLTITGCKGDEEIALCGFITGAIASSAGYSPSSRRSDQMMRDYANLSLLEQIDPVLFGSRTMPGGERINYSRECQGAARHPIPISIDEALAHPSPSVVILNNITYGGPQAYRAPTASFPVISFRSVPFHRYCVVCCVQKQIDASSLRWDEHSECARNMFYSRGRKEDEVAPTRSVDTLSTALQFDGNRIIGGRLTSFPKGVREILPARAFLYSPPEVDSSSLHAVIEWTVNSPLDDEMGRASNPYDAMANYAIGGVPVAFIRMTPVSRKLWRASLLRLSEFYDVPPYVICMWTEDAGSDKFPVSYHPIVTEGRRPLNSDELGLEIEYVGRESSERPFSYQVMEEKLPSYRIINTISFDEYCHAVTLSRKGEAPFLVPIRPLKTKAINPILLSAATLPTVKQLDLLVGEIKKVFPYASLSARTAIFDKKDRLLALAVDGIVLYVQPSTTMSKEIDSSTAQYQYLTAAAYDMIWGRIRLFPSSPLTVDSPFTVTSLRAARMYLAAKVIRFGIIRKIEKAVTTTTTGAVAAIEKLLLDECRRFVRIGKKTRISLDHGNIVIFSERAEMPAQLLAAAVKGMAAYCPRSVQLVLPYFESFGSILRADKQPLESWEKVVS